MAYIEAHQKLEKHPKLLELCNKTGWNKDEVIGKLLRLWWWTLDYAEDGDLSRYKPQQFLGDLIGNPKDNLTPEMLYKYLQDTNFIEINGLIHDWLDYAGHYLHAKYHSSNIKKWKEIRKKYKAYLRSAFRRPLGPNNLTLPNLTLPNLTIISQIEDLLRQFPILLQEKIKIYWDRARNKNKSKVITDGRRLTMLNELFNARSRCNNDEIFKAGLEAAIGYDAPNINYINAVIKNKITKKPLEKRTDYKLPTNLVGGLVKDILTKKDIFKGGAKEDIKKIFKE